MLASANRCAAGHRADGGLQCLRIERSRVRRIDDHRVAWCTLAPLPIEAVGVLLC